MAVLKLDRLWRKLPASRQQAIGSTLAQMIARQIAAMPSPLFKEENDE